MKTDRLVIVLDKRLKEAFKRKTRERGQSMAFVLKDMIASFIRGEGR